MATSMDIKTRRGRDVIDALVIARPGVPGGHHVWVGRHEDKDDLSVLLQLWSPGRRILSGDTAFDERVLVHGWVATRFRDFLADAALRAALVRAVCGDDKAPPMTVTFKEDSTVAAGHISAVSKKKLVAASLLQLLAAFPQVVEQEA